MSSVQIRLPLPGPLVKRLRHRPFTAVTWVRFPYGSPKKADTIWCLLFLPYGNRKAVKKTVRGTVFRPWEIPVAFRCIPLGCRWKPDNVSKTGESGCLLFLPYGNRKAVKKTVRGTVFRPWEIPVVLRALRLLFWVFITLHFSNSSDRRKISGAIRWRSFSKTRL